MQQDIKRMEGKEQCYSRALDVVSLERSLLLLLAQTGSCLCNTGTDV